MAIGCDHDTPRRGPFGYTRYDELLRTDDDGTVNVAETNFGTAQFPGPQPTPQDANFASRQSAGGFNGVNVRIAVYVQCNHDRGSVMLVTIRSCRAVRWHAVFWDNR